MSLEASVGSLAKPVDPPTQLDRAYRKILWRVMPILMLLWICAYLDRTNIGFAKLQMAGDVGLNDAAYGFAASVFFLGYLLFEVPSNLLLLKIGVRRTLTRIAIGWGAVCVLIAFVKTPIALYVLRFLLGAFEAGLYPGGLLYLTMILPTERRGAAIALFTAAGAGAGVIGGPLAGWLMTGLHSELLRGWQWVFIVEGGVSVLAGVLAWFMLSNSLETAPWLSPDERKAVLADIARDQTAIGPRQHKIRDALANPLLWAFCLVYACNSTGFASFTFWGPTILHDAGAGSPVVIGWIISGISLLSALGMLVAGALSDRLKDTRLAFAAMMLCCAVGMTAWGFSTHLLPGAVGALLSTTVTASAAVVLFWKMPNRYFSGPAVAMGMALISSVSQIGSFFAPTLLGVVKQTTGSISGGLWTVAGGYFMAFLITTFLIGRARTTSRPQP